MPPWKHSRTRSPNGAAHRRLFVVNDRVAVAASVGAGAHVGQGDDPGSAREILDPTAVLGVSVSTSDEAHAAEVAGADYLGVTVWATPTKPEAEPRGLDLVCARSPGRRRCLWWGSGAFIPGTPPTCSTRERRGSAWCRRSARRRDPVRATEALMDAVDRWEEGQG